MSKKKKIFTIDDAIKVIITPWDKGFSCGILFGKNAKALEYEEDICAIIARGMIKHAPLDPHTTYLLGLKGFAEDKAKTTVNDISIPLPNEDAQFDEENVIDFLEALKRKRDKELN